MTQALLFVASYVFTAGWLGLLRIIESMAETPEDELRMVVRIYPLMIFNACCAASAPTSAALAAMDKSASCSLTTSS